ncbi:potassium channel family protein [Undibacterium sp. Di26W]|uniref:potassium channel family protein n=1 Tax=Undibacterium sp. Di26W TaxID=3413035 RepID=UPI003BF3F849
MKSSQENIAIKTSFLFWISPTFKIAELTKNKFRKNGDSEEKLATIITRYNLLYLSVTLAFAFVIGIVLYPGFLDVAQAIIIKKIFLYIVGPLIFSRAAEIFIAFLRDAVSKMDGNKSSTNLTYGKRLELALKSYVELLVGFGLLYYILPDCFFKGGEGNFQFQSIIEAIYFSGATMTTLGYGDISPKHWVTQILVIFQLFCGMTLALVSFTVYTSLGLATNKNQCDEG